MKEFLYCFKRKKTQPRIELLNIETVSKSSIAKRDWDLAINSFTSGCDSNKRYKPCLIGMIAYMYIKNYLQANGL